MICARMPAALVPQLPRSQLLPHIAHTHLLLLLAVAAVAVDVGPAGGPAASVAALLAWRPRRLRPRACLGL